MYVKNCVCALALILLVKPITSCSRVYDTYNSIEAEDKAIPTYYDIDNNKVRIKLSSMKRFLDNSNPHSFGKYAERMREKESSGVFDTVNTFGYMGYYQFGKAALTDIQVKNYERFLKDKDMQHAAFVAYCIRNKYILRKAILKYNGVKIKGILITESGLLAAAHLKGAGTVLKWLKSKGKMSQALKSDAYGTSLEEYLKIFQGFDTSKILSYRVITLNTEA